jgi:hypothetical protein
MCAHTHARGCRQIKQHLATQIHSVYTINNCSFWLEIFPKDHFHESRLLAHHSVMFFLLCLDEHSLNPGDWWATLEAKLVIKNGYARFLYELFMLQRHWQRLIFSFVLKLTSFSHWWQNIILSVLPQSSQGLPTFGCIK